MELKELVGKHFLSGIETGTTERSKRFYGNETVSYVWNGRLKTSLATEDNGNITN